MGLAFHRPLDQVPRKSAMTSGQAEPRAFAVPLKWSSLGENLGISHEFTAAEFTAARLFSRLALYMALQPAALEVGHVDSEPSPE